MGLKSVFDEFEKDLSKDKKSKKTKTKEESAKLSEEELVKRMLKYKRAELDAMLEEFGKTIEDVKSDGFKNNRLGIAKYIVKHKNELSKEESDEDEDLEETDEDDEEEQIEEDAKKQAKKAAAKTVEKQIEEEAEEVEEEETEEEDEEIIEPEESKSSTPSMFERLRAKAAGDTPTEEEKPEKKKKKKKVTKKTKKDEKKEKKGKVALPEEAEVPETMIQETEEVKMDLKTKRRSAQQEKSEKAIKKIRDKTGEEYDFSEEKPRRTITVTIFGQKDEGKTAIGMAPLYAAALKKQHSLVIGFDHMAPDIKSELFKDNEYIHVVDGTLYWNSTDPELSVETGYTSMDFIMKTLIHYNNKYKSKGGISWVFFDGSRKMWAICEMGMRYVLGIKDALAGVERQQWKQRRWNFRDVYREGIRNSLRGVLFSAYVEKDEIIKDGQTISLLDAPVWTDVMLEETQITIRARRDLDKDPIIYTADVVSSKKGKIIKTGKKFNVTGTKKLAAFGDIFNR